jgi:hypothetical protein
VLPLFTAKWLTEFNDLYEVDFRLPDGDSLSEWAIRWCSVMSDYPNIIAVSIENELDYRLKEQTYTASDAANYMSFLTEIFRGQLQVPILTKLVGHFPGGEQDAIKEAVLPYVDLVGFDSYAGSPQIMGDMANDIQLWMEKRGYSTEGWWMTETNTLSNGIISADEFGVPYLESIFNHGASVVFLWPANRVKEPGTAFFYFDGVPRPVLIQIAEEIGNIQSATNSP